MVLGVKTSTYEFGVCVCVLREVVATIRPIIMTLGSWGGGRGMGGSGSRLLSSTVTSRWYLRWKRTRESQCLWPSVVTGPLTFLPKK